jgi:hypothetical protein
MCWIVNGCSSGSTVSLGNPAFIERRAASP